MTTTEIIAEFNSNINMDQDYTLVELKRILSNAYKEKITQAKEENPKKRGRPAKEPKLNTKGEEKKKREPSEK